MLDAKLASNFWLSEFLQSETATRRGIDNTPGPDALANLRTLVAPGMQRIRDLLRLPVVISSGFRCSALNTAIGGARTSQHMVGQAADFTCAAFGPPLKVARYILEHQAQIRFDQLIAEGTWVHCSFAPRPRGSVLTAHFGAGGTTYTPGL